MTIGGDIKNLQGNLPAHKAERAEREKELKVIGGQLMVEIPKRREKWTLQFSFSHYDLKEQVAITQGSICHVARDEKVITVFQAPNVIVRFKEHKMEMKGGVTIFAMEPKMKVQLQTLRWDWETGKLFGKGQVKIEGEKFSANADVLEGDTTLMRFSLKGNAKLEWQNKGDDQNERQQSINFGR